MRRAFFQAGIFEYFGSSSSNDFLFALTLGCFLLPSFFLSATPPNVEDSGGEDASILSGETPLTAMGSEAAGRTGRTVIDSRCGCEERRVWEPPNTWDGEVEMGCADAAELLMPALFIELLPPAVGVGACVTSVGLAVLTQEGFRVVSWFLCCSHFLKESERSLVKGISTAGVSFFSISRRSTSARFHGGREAK